MALRFEAPLGQRDHRYFVGVCLDNPTEENLWWNFERGTWEPYDDGAGCHRGTHAPCRTLRAFKRMLRKNPNIHGNAILCSRYRGYNVYDE